MGKFVDVYLDGVDEYSTEGHAPRGYRAMLTLVNKMDSHVLYKVRLSSHAKKNVMVKSNMGLLLSNSITTITLDVVAEAAFNVQIVTTPFDEENDNLQRHGISLTNFNDMWAFVPENKLDKTILQFNRDATGKPSASFYAPAFENSNQQEQEVMTVADDKLAPSSDPKPITAQNLAEVLSLVQQTNVDQEDEINQLKLKVKILTASSNLQYIIQWVMGVEFLKLDFIFFTA